LRKRIKKALGELPAAGSIERLVATSGTAVCCAALVELMGAREARTPRDARPPREARPPVGGLREVRVKELRRLVSYLAGLPRAAIAALPPVGEPRAESILAGAVLLEELIRRAGVDRFQVCDRALREGVVLEALGRPAAAAAPEEARRRQVERFARRVDSVYPHAEQTAQLALRLFDLLVSVHGLGAPEREWLEHAALLHDVGYSIHYRRHHQHSYYLITHAGLEGFDPAEVETIALVARYHRGRRPRKTDPQLAGLPAWQRRTVRGLAAILRLADALDRTHAHRVRDLYCSIRKKRARVEVVSDYDVALELEAARAKKRLFEKLYRVKLGFHQGLEAAR
jgi:exopolyphosphatase/guanosine-5'-triphosphate,3'-diphosphate pyrophosphatase